MLVTTAHQLTERDASSWIHIIYIPATVDALFMWARACLRTEPGDIYWLNHSIQRLFSIVFCNGHFLVGYDKKKKIYTLNVHSYLPPSLNLSFHSSMLYQCDFGILTCMKEPWQVLVRILIPDSREMTLHLINLPCIALCSEFFSM